ncbi:MAG TPA: hypothetical protein VIY96_01775 [Thermoanaerobaculia bacterium]
MKTAARIGVLILASIAAAAAGLAQEGGTREGAVAIRDDAPVYASAKGDKVEGKLKRGDAVALVKFGLSRRWLPEEVNGRLHVCYLQGEPKQSAHTGWMDRSDLSRFAYELRCRNNLSPLITGTFFSADRWSECFERARDAKWEFLRPLWEQADRPSRPAGSNTPASGTPPPPTRTAAPNSLR